MTSMAQMQNIARFSNVDTLKGATKAAIGLSAAFGIDLATAMDLIGKAAAGNTSMLGRYGIVLDETARQIVEASSRRLNVEAVCNCLFISRAQHTTSHNS
jgi:hypothetical protein